MEFNDHVVHSTDSIGQSDQDTLNNEAEAKFPHTWSQLRKAHKLMLTLYIHFGDLISNVLLSSPLYSCINFDKYNW